MKPLNFIYIFIFLIFPNLTIACEKIIPRDIIAYNIWQSNYSDVIAEGYFKVPPDLIFNSTYIFQKDTQALDFFVSKVIKGKNIPKSLRLDISNSIISYRDKDINRKDSCDLPSCHVSCKYLDNHTVIANGTFCKVLLKFDSNNPQNFKIVDTICSNNKINRFSIFYEICTFSPNGKPSCLKQN